MTNPPSKQEAKLLSPKQKLLVVEFLLSESDYDEQADTTEAKLLNQIYRVVHPSKDCRHYDWEQEAQKILNYLEEKHVKTKL